MTSSRPLPNPTHSHRSSLATLACAVLSCASTATYAGGPPNPEDIAQVTISSPVVKYLGRTEDQARKEEITVTARLAFEPITLTTNSGVALLKDRVVQAAHEICAAADPEDVEDDDACIFRAIKGADKQIDSAIARAKANHAGG